jgi:broad specificity phosphatase PhoE
MTPIFLVRAGRTAQSDEGRLQGRADNPLTAEGLADAHRAARRLAGAKVAAVYTSPLRRARQTAGVIARLVSVRPLSLQDLVDIDVGSWGGRTNEEVAELEPKAFNWYFRFPTAAEFPLGERLSDAERRVFGALEWVADRHRGRTVVAVTHELLIRLVLVRLKELEGTAIWDPDVPPGSVIELRATDEGLELPTVLEDLFRAAARKRSDRAGG